MIKVGLVGEAPSDTTSIINILKKIYDGLEFYILIDEMHGGYLDNQKIKHILRKIYETVKPDIVVFIRDLDGLIHELEKLEYRKFVFRESNSVIDKKGILLLCIYELEAFILADIEAFNRMYSTNISLDILPTEVIDPKGLLMKSTKRPKQYNVAHNPDIFEKLNIDKVKALPFFSDFLRDFDNRISELN